MVVQYNTRAGNVTRRKENVMIFLSFSVFTFSAYSKTAHN